MSVETHTITQRDPVHFRVTELAPLPVAEATRPGWLVLSVAFLNKDDGLPGMKSPIPPQWYQPYLEAIEEAIRSQQIYWVDWDYTNAPDFPPRLSDNTVQRLLRAIGDRQIVQGQDEYAENGT